MIHTTIVPLVLSNNDSVDDTCALVIKRDISALEK